MNNNGNNGGGPGGANIKTLLIWFAAAVLLTMMFSGGNKGGISGSGMEYSEFLSRVEQGSVDTAVVEQKRANKLITGKMKDGSSYKVEAPEDQYMISDLLKKGVRVSARPEQEPSLIYTILISWGPMLLLIGVWVWFMRQQMGGGKGGNNPFSFGKNRAKLVDQGDNPVTFADVAGCDEAKMDVEEVVEFLRDPTKFQKLGGRIPKGLLMVGPPGTGKTLLAKAIAGEAKVPFFAISGSDFVEMFVGVGASRVRDMFAEAKKNAPCIIFIDEIDAVGRQRGAGIGGGNDEREQTLNQMLVEMDGFEASSGIIIIGATNRPDVLDAALMRPGRLDRQVMVGLPDIRGREQILKVHTRKIPVNNDVDLKVLARGTPGFSGADLANLCNEAALFAARKDKRFVDMEDFELAKDKILMGAERRSILMPEHERLNTAYHESGHAVVAKLLPGADPVHKVTIIPRGRALGVTMQLPEQDRYSHNKQYLLNQIAILYGGRLAEEIFVNDMTTGASNDFQRATDLARRMVCDWGMSDLGIMVYGEEEGEVFLGRSVTKHKSVSEATQQRIDAQIKTILEEQYLRAKKLLEDNRDKVEAMTRALMDLETIDAGQIEDIMSGREIRDYESKKAEADARKAKIEQVRTSTVASPKDLPPPADASAS